MSSMISGISQLGSAMSDMADSGLLFSPGSSIDSAMQMSAKKRMFDEEMALRKKQMEQDRDLAMRGLAQNDRQMGLDSIGQLAAIRNQAAQGARGRQFNKMVLGLST